MLELFPGRFLEEIDTQVDMARIGRMLEMRRIRGVEERFKLDLAGKLAKGATSGDAEALSEHQRLLDEYGKYN